MAKAVSKGKHDKRAADEMGAKATPRQPGHAKRAVNAVLKDRRMGKVGKVR